MCGVFLHRLGSPSRWIQSLNAQESGSFLPWVVSAGSFRPGSFQPNFGVSRFGLFWWVVSAVSRFGPCRGGGVTLHT